MPRKKYTNSSQKKAPKTILQKLCQEIQNAQIRAKKHLTLHYKNCTNTSQKNAIPRIKIAQIRAKKAPNTTLQKLCEEKQNAQIRAKTHVKLG